MAIIRTIPRKGRRPAHTGRIMVDTVRGVLRVRKWPRKRPGPRTAIERFWSDWFTQANKLAKYADAMSQVRAIQMTKGSGMYPRDVLLKAMRGRLYAWTTPDGWKWYSMAAIGDVSESLDILAQTIGSVLVRAVDRWRAPPPGVIGDTLTYQGEEAPPIWASAAPPAAFQGGALVVKTGNQSIPASTVTALAFAGEAYDTDALHDPVTNNNRLTVPAGFNRVRLTGAVIWASSAVGDRIIWFRKNGANFIGQSAHHLEASTNTEDSIASPVVEVVAGDWFELVVFQNSGAALNLIGPDNNTSFSIELVS